MKREKMCCCHSKIESDDGTHTLNIFAIILAQTRGTYKMG